MTSLFLLHFGYAIFAIFYSVNHSLILVLKWHITTRFRINEGNEKITDT